MVVQLLVHRSQPVSLSQIYNIIFNKSKLKESPTEFVALVLEILSQIESQSSAGPLSVVQCVLRENNLKYLEQLPALRSEAVQTEFEEYELQYVFPLSADTMDSVTAHLATSPSLDEVLEFVRNLKESSGTVFSNFETMRLILAYVLKTYYFVECA